MLDTQLDLSDGQGIPLSVAITAASMHDMKAL
jgi:hypothetical protein